MPYAPAPFHGRNTGEGGEKVRGNETMREGEEIREQKREGKK